MALMLDDETKKRRAATGGVAPAIAAPAVNTFQGRPVDMSAGDRLNTVPAATPAATPAADPLAIAGQVGEMADRAALNAQGRINASTGPASADAETMRRLEIAQGGYKGSPGARRAVSEALLGQLGASRAAAGASVQPIAQAALAGQQQIGQQTLSAQQGQQQMALQQLQGDQQSVLEGTRQAGETERTKLGIAGNIDVAKIGKDPVGTYQRNAEGALALVQGATATPVTDASGNAFTQGAGDISAADRFKAYNERATAIQQAVTMTPEQKQQSLSALQSDPLFSPLFQQGAAAGAAPQGQAAGAPKAPANAGEFIQAMRARGSKMSDAELTAYFNSNYAKK